MISFLIAFIGCKDRGEKYAEPGTVIDQWVPTKIAECGFEVELPNGARRSEGVVGGGVLSVLYLSEVSPERYIVACITLPASLPTPTPAQSLRGQAENVKSVLINTGLVLSDMTLVDEDDGGRYELVFSTGMRIEGRVHLVGRQVHDISGSVDPKSQRSRDQLDRIFASYQRL